MKIFAAALIATAAYSVKLYNEEDDDIRKMVEELDHNEDGHIDMDELKASLEYALENGEICKDEAKFIKDEFKKLGGGDRVKLDAVVKRAREIDAEENGDELAQQDDESDGWSGDDWSGDDSDGWSGDDSDGWSGDDSDGWSGDDDSHWRDDWDSEDEEYFEEQVVDEVFGADKNGDGRLSKKEAEDGAVRIIRRVMDEAFGIEIDADTESMLRDDFKLMWADEGEPESVSIEDALEWLEDFDEEELEDYAYDRFDFDLGEGEVVLAQEDEECEISAMIDEADVDGDGFLSKKESIDSAMRMAREIADEYGVELSEEDRKAIRGELSKEWDEAGLPDKVCKEAAKEELRAIEDEEWEMMADEAERRWNEYKGE